MSKPTDPQQPTSQNTIEEIPPYVFDAFPWLKERLEQLLVEARIDELKRSIKPQETYDHYCIRKDWIDDRLAQLQHQKGLKDE